ncbi:MAG: hypothetical protein IJN29_06785 [Akkermansia sp.]|nr:hypothetical protein [Akkermansia sp.]
MLKKNVPVPVRALYPELFGMTAKSKGECATEAAALQMTMSGNTLNPQAAELWSVVAEGYEAAFAKKYADLGLFAHNVDNTFAVPAGVRPTIHVEVIETAGEAVINPTDWETSALENNYVEVKADRISRSISLNSYDLASGERWAGKREAAIASVLAGVYAQLGAAVKALAPTAAAAPAKDKVGLLSVDADTFGPEYVAENVSTVFGDYGQPDSLLLSPSLWGKVVPTNALSLNPETAGVYGVGKLAMSAGLGGLTADGKAVGLATLASGIAFGGGVPHLDPEMGCAVRSLGTICGVPMVLKVWGKPGSETIYESVETYAGFTVVNPRKVAILATA